MAEATNIVALPGIAALPPTTARQIGSGQVLIDPSSVVKELIDNALDARAKSIFVDITANMIDSIQVKDDGHGIPAEDRSLVCRRYCTRGRWLGFRGEALSSMTEMSGSFSVTTRVEGEPVAVRLRYDRNGELDSIEHDSHPVGTTVKASKFFEHMPVRKQAAIKNSSKCLAKLRRLMQAYAFARPTIRFRLRVLKAKNNNSDFIYAPKADANIEDAVLKIIGKDCALQCDWTALEADGFEIHAFLPKPTANGSKASNHGSFISVDARPVSASRGTIKKLITAFKDRLRKSHPSLAGVKDPFVCMNIICPPDSYDPNVEPAKDDVMFDNGDAVLGVVDKLLKAYYPEAAVNIDDTESLVSARLSSERQLREPAARGRSILPSEVNYSTDENEVPVFETLQGQPRWRSSMYGIDEDDLEFLQSDQAPVIEEEEERRAAEVSNPWTIARMNAAIKTKQSVITVQLPSPAKSQGNFDPLSSPSRVATTPSRITSAEPLTPQTLPKTNMARPLLDDESERRIQNLPPTLSKGFPVNDWTGEGHIDRSRRCPNRAQSETDMIGSDVQLDTLPQNMTPSQLGQRGERTSETLGPSRRAHSRIFRKKQRYINKPFAAPTHELNEVCFGQSIRDPRPSKQPHRQKGTNNPEVPLFAADNPPEKRRPVPGSSEKTTDRRIHSENNADIRSFFGQNTRSLRDDVANETLLNPFNSQAPPIQSRLATSFTSTRTRLITGNRREESRASSAEPRGMMEQLQAHSERERPPRPSSTGSQMSMLFHQRPAHVRDTSSLYSGTSTTPGFHSVGQRFQMSQTDSDSSHAPLPSSMGKHNQLLIPPRTKQVTTVSATNSNDRPTQSVQEMNAYFLAYSQENPRSSFTPPLLPPNQRPNTVQPAKPSSVQPHVHPSRRTTDSLERTKSSKLPLERTPKGFRVQNLVLALPPMSTHDIVSSARKLDMSANMPAWGYAAEDAHGAAFTERMAESRLMMWVYRGRLMSGGVDRELI
ncbi:dna mismatch repair protein [Stemphylium lycopersici]|nr:dna mismatch repair protein [Stemphylium lycopersici]RAR08597.1 dna mismatch repair protein [Stemphylium lycopersici]